MNLNEMVCGHEISTVLEDLGLNQISYFCWRWTGKTFAVEPYVNDEYSKTRAYLVAELLLILRNGLKSGSYLRVESDDAGWNITVINDSIPMTTRGHVTCSFSDVNPAHCLAECLAWLIDNKHVKVEDLKL